MTKKYKIITFYEFKELSALRALEASKQIVRQTMAACSVKGTVILSAEGFNATVCGMAPDVEKFLNFFEDAFETRLRPKASFHDDSPFKKIDVKIRPEIVSLRKSVDLALASGTHVSASEWNLILKNDEVVLLDVRNDYEHRSGTFPGAVNPATDKFSELPNFIDANLQQFAGKKVALFCTGGIRCEKFAPYLIAKGVTSVFQLSGGILQYLEQIDSADSLWKGECFVFDGRVTVNELLGKGTNPDYSQSEAVGRDDL